MQKFDVAVIGSGPAGAMAAGQLAGNGVKTVLVEKAKLPRYKTCGGGLVYRGRKLIPFDLGPVVECEIHSIDIRFQQGNIDLNSTRSEPVITMVMRDKFDQLLVERATEQGAILLEEASLKGLSFGNEVQLETTKGKIQAKYVIAADGALSPTAKLAGWKETRHLIPALECEVKVKDSVFRRLSQTARFDFDVVDFGYGWCFPKKDHLSIGLASTRKANYNLKKLYRDYLVHLEIPAVAHEEFHGFQIPLSNRTDGLVRNNVLLVGDAAGFADPVTAEGISNALLSGRLAADAIVEASSSDQSPADLYHQKLDHQLIPELKTSRYLAKVLYHHKRIRNFLLKRFGQRVCNAMTDIFLGRRSYPTNVRQSLQRKLAGVFGR